MEKKIERVPYISKWYKEELDWSQLFKFDFKDEPTTEETAKELNNCFKNTHVYFDKGAGSDWGVGNVWNSTITTTVSPKVNDNSNYHYHKPISPTLKFEHHFTQKDVEYLRELIHVIHGDIDGAEYTKSRAKLAHDGLCTLYNYLINSNGVRDKAQEKQLKELMEQSKPKKFYEGTLGEHWKELMTLFDVKNSYGEKWKTAFDTIIKNYKEYKCASTVLLRGSISPIADSLGIEFIEDFVKACEKCED